MQFTKEQFALMNVALQVTEKKEARVFPLGEQKDAMNIYEKLLTHVNEKENVFMDGEEDFTTQEKALILKLIDREWDVQVLKTVFSLRDLLQ